ncbi:MAG: Integral rane protein CcmA involved in cell shape determination [Gemmatimonadetes bacterium]|jgi:cytoskeletal protein CcmA (bactofilin family)|nr:Integral rane protein CcmA involved in cell shape determination [Gemmatimonadota bacterium]
MRFTKRSAGTPRVTPPAGFSLLDGSVSMTGDIDTAGSLRVDGRLEGSIRRADIVVVGVGATVSGDVHAREVIVGGTLNGTVHASERVELQSTAIVTGDLITQSVLMQEGGVVNGRVLMRPPESQGQSPAPRAMREPSKPLAPASGEPVRR